MVIGECQSRMDVLQSQSIINTHRQNVTPTCSLYISMNTKYEQIKTNLCAAAAAATYLHCIASHLVFGRFHG